jgi:hypothetical protein
MPSDPRPARQPEPADPPVPLLPPEATPEASEPVRPRTGAVVDTTVVRTESDAAVKHNTFPSRPGYPRAMTSLETHLHVEAWVKNSTYAKNVWVDVHVFESHAEPVHRATLPLSYARPAGDGGDVFVLDTALYQGLVATPGSVTLRPDARLVQYRLYGELDGTVYTDGVLHRCELRPDSASG